MTGPDIQDTAEGVAIIGMSGRFPGASNVTQFWQNIRDGVEAIQHFSAEELRAAGVDPRVLDEPGYVNAGGTLEGIDLFDAAFFGFNPREADIIDPQQRLFLECAWESLESAGYDPYTYGGLIGVFAGAGMGSYGLRLYSNPELVSLLGGFQLTIGNEKDHLTTRVSYKLNLRGPSIDVQTTCSTSLVAICLACHSLLSYQCEIALAGGVAVAAQQKTGYFYQEGGILSPDGHCRTFDADAQGTVGGSGVGVVVLKRLADALADGDTIHAVIKGAAINNDGSVKVGYTAPSVDGQAEAIAMAQNMAGVHPDTIDYIEAHGTATPLGDPIEIAALTQVFRAATSRRKYCAIGSVKTNIGHLDAAAGVAGLIKTVMALKHRQIPASLHFRRPNPNIDFESSPFYVNATLREWPRSETPRRAGVSSFGIGGTNAHVVLEEAPQVTASPAEEPAYLLPISARTPAALEAATANLADFLESHPDANLADVAYTLQVGRAALSERRAFVCGDLNSAVTRLRAPHAPGMLGGQSRSYKPVAFMFPGQGAQYVNMGRELYEREEVFREHIDACAEILKPHMGLDLRDVLYPGRQGGTGEEEGSAGERINQTWITQPALFAIEYALARLWMEWGVQPDAMIGHSIGEYVAACLAGVFTLEDALALVAARGRVMQRMPLGSMLAVGLPRQEVEPLLAGDLSLAAVNGPAMCVVSGPTPDIESFGDRLAERGIESRRLRTSHAFHSVMMEPALGEFFSHVRAVELHAPQKPFISNLTGTWITGEEATNPAYWRDQLRGTVLFAAGIEEMQREGDPILLEVGPGRTLSTLARAGRAGSGGPVALCSMRHPQDQQPDEQFLLNALGRLWVAGVAVDWAGLHTHHQRRRVPLPTYPFERQRHWVESQSTPQPQVKKSPNGSGLKKRADITDWFYLPSWRRVALRGSATDAQQQAEWLMFVDDCKLGVEMAHHLAREGRRVITVSRGERFSRVGTTAYTINPARAGDYLDLLGDLAAQGPIPGKIVHLWNVTPQTQSSQDNAREHFETAQEMGFYSVLFLAQAIAGQGIHRPIDISVISNGLQDVTGDEALCPEKATVLGLSKVIAQEYPEISCRSVDIALPGEGGESLENLARQVLNECLAPETEPVVALRRQHRWVQAFEPLALEASALVPLREKGVYLITGGLGNMGFILAEYLVRKAHARLILLGRSALPPRNEWPHRLATHSADDPIAGKIAKVLDLEALGGQVSVVSADVSDAEAMRLCIDKIYRDFGALHGIIHAAGTTSPGSFRPLDDMDRATCERHFVSKALGLLALEDALRGRSEEAPDFYLLISSLASILGGLGFAGYSAANAFLDATACKNSRGSRTRWTSVNWDGWRFRDGAARSTGVGSSLAELAILPWEGADALGRILSTEGLSQVAVSTGDLKVRMDRWVRLESLRDTQPQTSNGQTGSVAGQASGLHIRPNLSSAYVAPRTEVEHIIAEAWQKLLGVAQVGAYDDFFELGGHSLMAIQLISRLRDTFHVELTVHKLFDAPTVAQLAEIIERSNSKLSGDEEQIAHLLEMVEKLSDEEIAALLAEDGTGSKA